MPHWTDLHFMRLAKEGYKYGFLRHSGNTASDTPDSAFIGYHGLDEIAKQQNGKEKHGTFYALAPSLSSYNGMPPHHHYMIFEMHQKSWFVLGYVVELWRYK